MQPESKEPHIQLYRYMDTIEHPGEILKREMKVRQINQLQLAEKLGIHYSQLNEVIKGKRKISLELAFKLEDLLILSANFWLSQQLYFEIQQYRNQRLTQ